MRLLTACLLAASGGLARQQLPDGSAPLSPFSHSSEPLYRPSRVFPFPPPRLASRFPQPARQQLTGSSRPRAYPSLLLSLFLFLPRHPTTFQHSPSHSGSLSPSLSLSLARSLNILHPLRCTSLFLTTLEFCHLSRIHDITRLFLPHAPLLFHRLSLAHAYQIHLFSFPILPRCSPLPLVSRAFSLPPTRRFLSSRSLARCHVATTATIVVDVATDVVAVAATTTTTRRTKRTRPPTAPLYGSINHFGAHAPRFPLFPLPRLLLVVDVVVLHMTVTPSSSRSRRRLATQPIPLVCAFARSLALVRFAGEPAMGLGLG